MLEQQPIEEIAAELAGYGEHAHVAAVQYIESLKRAPLDDAGRWQATLRILAAMDLVRELRARTALGEFDEPA